MSDTFGSASGVARDSELGLLTTTTTYNPGFTTTVTNPRSKATTTGYLTYDQPSTEAPLTIALPEGVTTTIARDPHGKPLSVTRSGSWNSAPLSATRSYVYDGYQQLCKTINPESGAALVDYDAAGNLAWSVDGTALTTLTCDRASVTAGLKTSRSYDLLNRLTAVSTPGGVADQLISYYPDGAVNTRTAANPGSAVATTYTYNKRRMLVAEAAAQPGWYSWTLGYTYTANGHLASQSYPTGLVISYAPNALGQATQAGSYATGVTYYPNGGIAQFTYGNGIVHTMTGNARTLPARSQDMNGATAIVDDSYTYDANGNVTNIADQARAGATNRAMAYDGLDRLTSTVSPTSTMFGSALYGYDPLDNLRTSSLGIAGYSYGYDANNRLVSLARSGGSTYTYVTDAQGNISNDGRQAYAFDSANRLNGVTGKETYRYDGLGRRAENLRPDGSLTLSQYSQAGQLLFRYDNLPSQRTREHVYLAGSLVATIDHDWPSNNVTAVKYQHTDALGSPVAVTDAGKAVLERTSYSPYGAPIDHPVDGVGYTGHVIDMATGLTYMQQRYYDPLIGRFLSVDPMPTNPNNGANFNRYNYANNNPYRFIDPDGRVWQEIKDVVRNWASTTSNVAQTNAYATSAFTPSSDASKAAADGSRTQLAVQGAKAAGALGATAVVGTGVVVAGVGAAPVVAAVAEGAPAVASAVAQSAIPVSRAAFVVGAMASGHPEAIAAAKAVVKIVEERAAIKEVFKTAAKAIIQFE